MARRGGWQRRWSSLAVVATGAVVAAGLSGCAPTGLRVETVASGLEIPWDLAFTPGGRLLFTERPGRISVLDDGQRRVLATPPDVVAASEAGMMGLAVDPDFASNRLIYGCLASTKGGAGNDVRVARWRVNRAFTDLTNRRDIVTGAPVNASGQLGRHSGCRPRFGPDGYLWIGTGDAAVGTAPQDPLSLAGKVLRVDRGGRAAPGNLGAPFDARIFSFGHRNVQGLAFRPSDGLAFSVEHGPDRDDEINRLGRRGNRGWNPVPGYNENVPMTDLAAYPKARQAVWSSGPSTIAPSGAAFVRGRQWGRFRGAMAVAVLKDEQLRMFRFDEAGRYVSDEIVISDRGRLRSVVPGPDGALYVTTADGGGTDEILRISPN